MKNVEHNEHSAEFEKMTDYNLLKLNPDAQMSSPEHN